MKGGTIWTALTFTLAQAADVLATVGAVSHGAEESNPLLRDPVAWVLAKAIVVTAVIATLSLLPRATLFRKAVLWTSLLTTAAATWNLLQSFGG